MMNQSNKKFRAAILDDHDLFREGFALLIKPIRNLDLIGSVKTARQFKRFISKVQPDIIFMDIFLPDGNGIELTEYVKRTYPDIIVIGLSVSDDPDIIRKMMEVGATDYFPKSISYKTLKSKIEKIIKGQAPDIKAVTQTNGKVKKKAPVSSLLTPRENEIALLIAEGNTNQKISEMLNLSKRTVETHRKHILDKLGARTTAEMVQKLIKTSPVL